MNRLTNLNIMAQYQENAIVTFVEQLTNENFRIGFKSTKISKTARAGQFVMVRVNKYADPLLRRPFCIHQVEGDELTIYLKVVGRGTELLSQLDVGQEVSLLGALGNGFTIHKSPSCLIGGGLGIAPLLLLAKSLSEKNDASAMTIILGGRNSGEVEPLVADFEQYNAKVYVATDDGSYGEKGFVTDVFTGLELDASTNVYTCGPEAMMARIHDICLEKSLACQVSVEEEMACGMGACLGCCKTKADGDYTHVCINGPVYKSEELKWEK
ncbi:MAG: dihydroorotate dehydrogenase electron transfer subunit [Desulfotalea sp.]